MRIVWLESAILDLQRFRDFIQPHNKEAAQRAVRIIRATVAHIAANPHIGKPVDDLPDYHDSVIPFGTSRLSAPLSNTGRDHYYNRSQTMQGGRLFRTVSGIAFMGSGLTFCYLWKIQGA